MLKFLFSLVLAFFAFVNTADAQNLYINEMSVRYENGITDNSKYCKHISTSANLIDRSFVTSGSFPNVGVWGTSALIEFDQPRSTDTTTYGYPNSCLSLCASIQCNSSTAPIRFGVDELTFEVFKYGPGTNPRDPSSAPPIHTISINNLGNGRVCDFTLTPTNNTGTPQNFGIFCASWDGSYNLNGQFGKTNGQFGFRATVRTSQTTSQGTQIDIEQTSVYPGQNQIPIQVDVTNLHQIISTVTAVGKVGVAAQPYNLTYQLSKDATVSIRIYDSDTSHGCTTGASGQATFSNDCLVRTIIDGAQKVGEGNTTNPIANGDFWDGRNEEGAMMPAGSYVALFTASSNDEWGKDNALPTTIQMTLDPLQITDIGIKPLGASSTDYAVLSYILTEAATVRIRIYPPGTEFDDVNDPNTNPTNLNIDALFMSIEQKQPRTTVTTLWDGRDTTGVPVCDGNYVYIMDAYLPSSGTVNTFNWNEVTTRKSYVGTIPVIRGEVVSSFSPSSTVIGSSPTAAGLAPFYFEYSPVRDTEVTLQITKMDGQTLVRRIVDDEARAGRFKNKDIWDGIDLTGKFVSSGTYIAELVTRDPYNCPQHSISTKTAIIPVDLFRTVDVRTAPLLSSASSQASISYQLSETMYVDFRIYEPSVVINPSTWPPTFTPTNPTPIYTINGVRPRRMNITDFWDGKDSNGRMKSDGVYPYVLLAYSTGTPNVMYSTDKTYGTITISRGQLLFNKFDVFPTIPTTYNSSETVHLPPYGIEYSLMRQSTVTIRIVETDDSNKVLAEIISGENRDANTQYTDYWDGKCNFTSYCYNNDFVSDGSYKVMVIAEDADAEIKKAATSWKVIDVAPLRLFDVSIQEVGATPGVISYQLSEPMKVITKIYKPGTDVTGFTDPPGQLVKRIIGVRSARTPITETWDGTDLTMFPVDDGTYVFSIFGTTVTTDVNSLDGSFLAGRNPRKDYDTEIYDRPQVFTIPVSRDGTFDVCQSFQEDSFFAPNPYEGKDGWFRIPIRERGIVDLKIYNLAGDLVYSKNFGEKGVGESIDGKDKCVVNHNNEACWPKVNNAGKQIAHGVYFAVLRFESTEGLRKVCQTVKKILIP